MSRIVRLLDVTELTPRQLAQKRYQESAKGKAAWARYRGRKRLDAAWRAAEVARVMKHDAAHRLMRRVYKRIWQQTAKRLKLAA